MLLVVLAALVSAALAGRPGFIDTGNLEWRDCGNSADRWIAITKFDISPKPIKVPGDLVVDIDSNFAHKLENILDMDVVIEKELLGVFTKVTCVKSVGTCHYDDPCKFINTFKNQNGCPQQLVDNGLPCSCPFNPSQIKLTNTKFTVAALGDNWSFLATGNYHIKITVNEKANHKVRGCMEAYIQIRH